ncbi:hypothetical protein EYF80_029667 [Liparis tanakae]|uniref:Uncharacterized protein n=1 Tax=Liparis tanakae TaxID=230148 RepID=A0A4Z2H4A2_9TELE|nr:hypothetical protein EYF80_029667 [Liparis tanakae]
MTRNTNTMDSQILPNAVEYLLTPLNRLSSPDQFIAAAALGLLGERHTRSPFHRETTKERVFLGGEVRLLRAPVAGRQALFSVEVLRVYPNVQDLGARGGVTVAPAGGAAAPQAPPDLSTRIICGSQPRSPALQRERLLSRGPGALRNPPKRIHTDSHLENASSSPSSSSCHTEHTQAWPFDTVLFNRLPSDHRTSAALAPSAKSRSGPVATSATHKHVGEI